MKAHIQIPKGWRRLRVGSLVTWTDRVLVAYDEAHMRWEPVDSEHVGPVGTTCVFIRRIKTKKGNKS